MSQLLQGFAIGMGGVLALTGAYLFGACVRIMLSRDPFAPKEFVWVALPFAVIAMVLGGLMLWLGLPRKSF